MNTIQNLITNVGMFASESNNSDGTSVGFIVLYVVLGVIGLLVLISVLYMTIVFITGRNNTKNPKTGKHPDEYHYNKQNKLK